MSGWPRDCSSGLSLQVVCPVDSAPAQEPARPSPTRGDKAKADPKRVLASVGEQLITQADVDLNLGRTASGRSDLPEVPEPILMITVDIIAQRRQALESLKRSASASVIQRSIHGWWKIRHLN